MAALAFTRPSPEFRVETAGWPCPVGHTVRYPNGPPGTTVTFREYAAAVGGTPHALLGMMKSRQVPPLIGGPPKGPLGFRVSATRHGVIGMNCNGPENGSELAPPIIDTVPSPELAT